MSNQSLNSSNLIPQLYLGCLQFHFEREIDPSRFTSTPPEYAHSIEEVVNRYVDKDRGGLQAHCLDAIRDQAPHLYDLARDHRRAVWKRRKDAGIAAAIRVGNIPPETTHRQLLMALELARVCCHVEFEPRRGPTSSVVVCINRAEASHLLNGSLKPSIGKNLLSITEL